MIKLFRIIKFFFVYRKNVIKNRKYLEDKYGFIINIFSEFYTTVTFADAPPELKEKLGKALVEVELKKFIAAVNADLPKLELNELVNLYEIKKVDDDNWGVAFGYSLASNRKVILSLVGITIALLAVLGIIIF